MRYLTISIVLGNSYPSCNFNFWCNLTDLEIVLIEKLMSSLTIVHLFYHRFKNLILVFLSLFLVKSFFTVLSKSLNLIPFLLANFDWKSKAPSKVKAFAWLVVRRKVNTNDMLQVRRSYKSLSAHWCILYQGSGESIDHIFLHYLIMLGLWHKLFTIANMDWVPSRSIGDRLVILFRRLGNLIRGKTLWHNTCLTVLWIVW